MFADEGAVVVASTYTKVGGVFDFGFRHDPSRPLESMAEYCMGCYTNLSLPARLDLNGRFMDAVYTSLPVPAAVGEVLDGAMSPEEAVAEALTAADEFDFEAAVDDALAEAQAAIEEADLQGTVDEAVVALMGKHIDKLDMDAAKHIRTLPVLLGNAETGTAWQVRAYPTYFVIDEDGAIASRSVGYSTYLGLKTRTWMAQD